MNLRNSKSRRLRRLSFNSMHAIACWVRFLLLVGGLGFASVEPQAAKVSVPANTAPVVDNAQLFSQAFEDGVDQKLRAVFQQTGIQISVLSVPSLEGLSIEEFGIEVASAWKLGNAKTDKGLIVILAPTERRVRIEVGHGLEGDFTDLQSGRVINDVMIPYFKRGDWESGTLAGLHSILSQIAPDMVNFEAPPTLRNEQPDIGSIVFAFTMFIIFVALFMEGGGGGGGGGRRRRRRSSSFLEGMLLGGLLGGSRGSGGSSGWGGGGDSWGGGGGSFGGGGASGSW